MQGTMPKRAYVDVDLLEFRIKSSKQKIEFLCENLGISRQAFAKKRKGITPFKASEIFVLCTLLHIDTLEEKSKIFLPYVEKEVDCEV